MATGTFIVFDGNNGAGKTTQMHRVAETLREEGHTVMVTREPGGTPTAEAIREMLLRVTDDPSTPTTEMLLFIAARAHHVETKIQPALAEGQIVLCDRYTPSTIAFQCAGRGFPEATARAMEELALGAFKPDHHLIFDLDPREGLAHNAALADVDGIEQRGLDYLDTVRESFLEQAHKEPDLFSVIDASASKEVVFDQVMTVTRRCLGK
ncbi:MAG: dTMP kinase [Marinobacter sp. T13-3]|nr:MAG: dTMP kinase [Marinobacter sp. T13-3]